MPRKHKPNGTRSEKFHRIGQAMKAQEYDACPPVCASCRFVTRARDGIAAECMVGKFFVRLGGICNFWKDAKTGETLG